MLAEVLDVLSKVLVLVCLFEEEREVVVVVVVAEVAMNVDVLVK